MLVHLIRWVALNAGKRFLQECLSCAWRRRKTARKPCRCRPPNLTAAKALEDEQDEEGAGDSGADPSPEEEAAPDQAAADPGHFLAKFNCAAAIGIAEEPGARSRLKRYDFAVEATLGPGTFHRSKVGPLFFIPSSGLRSCFKKSLIRAAVNAGRVTALEHPPMCRTFMVQARMLVETSC
jgi:hypothetical protein